MQQLNLIAAGCSPMAAISVTILPDASLETDAKVSSHLKMTVPASWIQKKRPMRKLLDAALKQWQLTDRSYALRRKDGTALDLDASLGTLEEGAKLVVGVAAARRAASSAPGRRSRWPWTRSRRPCRALISSWFPSALDAAASRCPRPTRRTRPGGAVGQRDRPGRAATLGCMLDGIVQGLEAEISSRRWLE